MSGHFLHELKESFLRHGSRCALVYQGRPWTYAELEAAALRCAAWLQGLGVGVGERVMLVTPDKLPFLVGHLGVLFGGATPLPLNPRFTREELRYFLADSGARVVIAGAEQREVVEQLVAELAVADKSASFAFKSAVVVPDQMALDPPGGSFVEPFVSAEDACLILYSSGTTGWPKGVVHENANVGSSLAALAACWRMNPDDVVVNALPLFHIHGLAFATHLTWLTGGCLHVEDAFEPAATMKAIGRGTVFMAVPPMYYKLLAERAFAPAAKGWGHVRLFTCGSAPIRPEVLPELEGILQSPVINRYGMSEAFVITSLPLDGPWPNGSVGLPLKGVELRVVRDDGTSVEGDEVGAVQVRGLNLFKRYWNKPEATAAAFQGDWFDTGDLGRRDAKGFLTLVGRKHDLIIVSGYNVYPQVVERVIGECPGVAECAVVGVVDEKRGEAVAVAIVRQDRGLGETDLRAWCQERLIHYQQPRQIVFVEALPKNSLGKVLRRELREQF
jgi:malonyl-CoA/methylmalonyl-CoA synthetase